MTRSRATAKAAGARFERAMADYLRDTVSEWIDRRTKAGARDLGDLANLRAPSGGRIVAECKDTARINLAGWAAETETERRNDGAIAGVIIHKRHGRANPADQWVTMTAADFAAILTGTRPEPKGTP